MVFSDNQLITLSSRDGIKNNDTYLSDMVFNFKGILKEENNIVRVFVRVLNAQIPVSFYTIDATNNILSYKLTSSSTIKLVVVANGNYNATTFIAKLTSFFIANGDPITVSFNSQTGKLTFASTVSYTYYNKGINGCTMGDVIGIGTTSIAGTVKTCPYPLNLLNKSKLFIQSNSLFNVAYTSYNLGFTTTIAAIPVNQPPYNLINYVSLSESDKVVIHNTTLNSIDIQILDETDNFINFNNIDWSMTLCLSIEREDQKKMHIENFSEYMQYSAISGTDNDEAVIPPLKELTQDEKDLELLQK
jgi:hypothetical protein